MVVLMHSPIPFSGANGLVVSSVSYFTAPCIGLFFMVSGALLLPPPPYAGASSGRCAFSVREFVLKRLRHVLAPTLFWTAFYLFVKTCEGEYTIGELVKNIFSIPFSAQGHGVLWFMYTLIGLYLATPILVRWLRSATEKEVSCYLCLWFVSLCFPVLRLFLDVNESATGTLYYFSGYIGYYVLGYWLLNYSSRISLKLASMVMVIVCVAPIVVRVLRWEVDFYSLFWYLSVFVAAQCVFWWKLVCVCVPRFHISRKFALRIALLSKLTFGIYLSHIFIMRDIVWRLPFVALIDISLPQILITAFLTLALSVILTRILYSTSIGRVVIGCQKKK